MPSLRRVGWAAVLVGTLGASSCVPRIADTEQPTFTPVIDQEATPVPLDEALARNHSRYVDPRFDDHPLVVTEEYGLETSKLLFDRSDGMIIAEDSLEAQLRAASLAVFAHVPMITYNDEIHTEINAEINRLGALRVLLVGDVPLAESSGTYTVFQDPGGREALGELTAHSFSELVVSEPEHAVEAVTRLDGTEPVLLEPAWAPTENVPAGDLPALPVATRRDGQNAPVTVASAQTPIASVANAQAYGADVRYLDQPDPRESETAYVAMAGLHSDALLALGEQFGTNRTLAAAIAEADRAKGVAEEG
ncbi:hypothetical protein [Corynebacterium yudongzhengii]|uniref:hypothetical protein n=1 Tax=Corynebacterium yudongzhengii TaxID=2080740 RepID=UPI0011B24590|nr:hypothetical protein [Corynebacterium yudongzhengii]